MRLIGAVIGGDGGHLEAAQDEIGHMIAHADDPVAGIAPAAMVAVAVVTAPFLTPGLGAAVIAGGVGTAFIAARRRGRLRAAGAG